MKTSAVVGGPAPRSLTSEAARRTQAPGFRFRGEPTSGMRGSGAANAVLRRVKVRTPVAGHDSAPVQRTLNGASPLKVALPLNLPVARLNTLEVAIYPPPWRHVPGREPTYGVKFR